MEVKNLMMLMNKTKGGGEENHKDMEYSPLRSQPEYSPRTGGNGSASSNIVRARRVTFSIKFNKMMPQLFQVHILIEFMLFVSAELLHSIEKSSTQICFQVAHLPAKVTVLIMPVVWILPCWNKESSIFRLIK